MMEQKQCIAVFDVGTTAVKVCLFSPTLTMLACSVQEYTLSTHGDCVEAGARQYKSAICAGLAEAQGRAPEFTIAALGLTTQGETLAAVQKNGEPLRPFLVWLDGRAEEEAALLQKELPGQLFYETTGLPEPTGALPLAKLLWLRLHEPEIFAQTHKFLLLEDYLLFWMTGRFLSEKSLQTSTGWFDIRRDCLWSRALDAAGIDEALLPELLECGEPAGPLLAQTARELNLPAGIPVVTGAMDQTAAALAAGCVGPGIVTETTGTALVMAACTDSPVFSKTHHLTVYRHALKGNYLYLPIGNTAGMALRWFRDEFCKDLPRGGAGYAALDELARQVAPGCEGLVFLPYLSGSVDPDACPQAKAVFFGASLSTTRAHFVRAVMESVSFMLADFMEMLAGLGCPCNQLYSLGGGAKSPVWQQMKADVCGRAFSVPACSEATAMGAALLAGWGSGLIPAGSTPAQEAAAQYSPNAQNKEVYQKARALYRSLYRAVRPLY